MIQKCLETAEEFLLGLSGTQKCLLGGGVVLGVTLDMEILVVAVARVHVLV